jgi:serine phosphatase RsbU (regulator of sigma subunit)/Tfp pilus assembly protein PilF
MKKLYLIVLLIFTIIFITPFTKASIVDSLIRKIKTAQSDTLKVRLLNTLSEKYYNLDIDSSYYYAKNAYSLSSKINFKKGKGDACSNIGEALYYKGEYKNAIQFIQEAINMYESEKYVKGLIDAYISLGQTWKELGNYPKSIDNYLLALKAGEKNKDESSIGRTMISLGVLFLDQGKYDEALKYSKNALPHLQKANIKSQIANAYARIGNVFGDKENPYQNSDSTLYYYKLSLDLFTEIGHQRGIGVIFNNIAGIYLNQNEPDKAIEYYKKAYVIRNKLGDQNGMAIILNNLGSTYKSIKQYQTALKYLNQSLDISKKICKPEQTSDNYKSMASCYAEIGDYKKAYFYKTLYIDFKDSLFNDNNSRLISEMQTKYETEKKEKEIEILNQNKIVSELKNKEQQNKLKFQKYVIYGSSCVILVFLSLSFFLLRLFFQKQKANSLLQEQNIEITQQREEIITQRDEIEAQRDLVTQQKEDIEEIHEEVTSSIRYAQRIQEAVLPSPDQLQEILGNYFIIYKPCNIVSGDFYWATRIKQWIVFCVADCTGHGVPGGFMSMLGISFLNEIVRKEDVNNTSEILDHLREHMILQLKQKGHIEEQKDGLDIALCAINVDTLELQFSGAYNSCYIVRNNNNEQSELFEIKGDKMPIAIHQHMESFTLKEFKLKRGDFVYLFSDGFADQFGGLERKKFLTSNLRISLKSINHLELDEQKNTLEKIFSEWKRDYNQVDDVTIIGLNI